MATERASLTATGFTSLLDTELEEVNNYPHSANPLTASQQIRLQLVLCNIGELKESLDILINANIDKPSTLKRLWVLKERIDACMENYIHFSPDPSSIPENIQETSNDLKLSSHLRNSQFILENSNFLKVSQISDVLRPTEEEELELNFDGDRSGGNTREDGEQKNKEESGAQLDVENKVKEEEIKEEEIKDGEGKNEEVKEGEKKEEGNKEEGEKKEGEEEKEGEKKAEELDVDDLPQYDCRICWGNYSRKEIFELGCGDLYCKNVIFTFRF